jgi:hypothetical protein
VAIFQLPSTHFLLWHLRASANRHRLQVPLSVARRVNNEAETGKKKIALQVG